MDTSRLLALIDEFEGALGEHDSDRALVALSSLEELDPDDAAWPKRRAEIYREAGDEASELNALLRTASLQVDAGFVARAMASCNRILEISPGHPPTEEMMSLLYEMPSTTASETSADERDFSPAVDLSKVAPATPETPLQEIVLTDVVAGTRSVVLTDVEESSGVAEISLGNDQPEELDLACQLRRASS